MEVIARLLGRARTVDQRVPLGQSSWAGWVERLLVGTPPCRFCDDPGQPSFPVCRACEDELPWIEHACSLCGIPLEVSAPTCGPCLRAPPPWRVARSSVRYAYPADWPVRRLKFGGDAPMAWLMAGVMTRRLPAFLSDRPLIVPVPLHRRRRRERGYDQAEELARLLASATGLRQEPVLRRRRATSPQVGLGARARRRNLAGAFEAKCRLEGRTICLIDDVMTTGSTAAACTETLRDAGAGPVYVWSYARAE